MKIHKEGFPLILTFCLITLGIFLAVEIIFPVSGIYHYLFYALCLISLAFVSSFFRSPHRVAEAEDNAILCPCDGKVVVIENTSEDEYFKSDRIQVSIFMSPLNVHVNWYPVKGTVNYYKYWGGRYLVAWHPKSSEHNERTTVVIKHESGHEILLRQIAGAMARRIVCYAKNHVEVEQGEELGFIKFGSRVDLFLPKDTKINVNLNQKVIGKKTVIGWLSEN